MYLSEATKSQYSFYYSHIAFFSPNRNFLSFEISFGNVPSKKLTALINYSHYLDKFISAWAW